MTFSPSEAAFEGFRLARRRPLTVVALSIIGLVSAFATYWVMDVSGYIQAVAAMGATPSPEQALAAMPPLFRFIAGCGVIGCIVSAIQAGAVYRGVLRPQEHGLLGLALGVDELRLAGLALAVALLGTLILFAVSIPLSLVLGIVGMATSPYLMVAGIYLVLGVLSVWLGTRMSLAGPATFARRKISVFSAWPLTRAHFWALLGCYVLTVFLGLLIAFIMFVVAITAASVLTGVPFMTALGEFAGRQPGAVIDIYSPVRVVYTLVASLFGGLLTMVMTAPAAEAYRQIHGGAETQAEAFS